MTPTLPLMIFMSVLFPAKLWVGPMQPLTLDVKGGGDVSLVLTDFAGKTVDASDKGAIDVSGDQKVDLKRSYTTAMNTPGTYVLWAVPKGQSLPAFVGTPLVIEVRKDTAHPDVAGPLVARIEPLTYAQLSTADQGDMTILFYFKDAPNTCDSFINLAEGGLYDGLTFFRVVPDFIIQTGDPRNDGSGGPGFQLPAEFNDQPHVEGVLSMARENDPKEDAKTPPSAEYANSGGSQFFICLNAAKTKALDQRYTAFAQVADGMDTVKAIGALPVGGAANDAPKTPAVIKSVRIMPVTPANDPYASWMHFPAPSTQPATAPATTEATEPSTAP